MANTYRKLRDGVAWHFCSNCSHWPTSNFVTHEGRPSHKDICNECMSKKVRDDCK
jgi:hypothetical protein